MDSLINEDKFDHSELAKVDPDTNSLALNRQGSYDYYNDLSFNDNIYRNNKFSFFHVNIQSLPRNVDHLKIHLNDLKHSFTSIAVLENWLTTINKDIIISLKGLLTQKHYKKAENWGRGVAIY